MFGQLAPAIGCDFTVARIESNNDVARKRAASIVQKARVFDGCRTDDHVRDAEIEIAFNRIKIANAATNLHGDIRTNRIDNGADHRLIFRFACNGTVEVNQV